MESKFLEIRDSGTFIPALAIRISGEDGYLAQRAGFESPCVCLVHLEEQRCAYDPYDWVSLRGRTMLEAHIYVERHWAELKNGDVVDVEFILGITTEPKRSEEQF